MKKYDTIIVGAGPSGLMCANQLKENNFKDFIIIDQNDKVGKKLSITGNSRCNVTNNKPVEQLLTNTTSNAKFLYPTLNIFAAKEIISFFQEQGLELKEENDNRMFPVTNKAIDIINILIKKLETNIMLETIVNEINYEDGYFILNTSQGVFKSNKLVIATGGISYSWTGSNGDGYKFAKFFKHKIIPPFPVYVSVSTKNENDIHASLQGITLENASITYKNKKYSGSLLFTHFGLSGPLIFRLSHHLKYQNDVIYINLIDADTTNLDDEIIINLLNDNNLPKRVIKFLQEKSLLQKACNLDINILNNMGFKKAFITRGGVSTREINPKNFESKLQPSLYFIGEVIDVESYTGGYNITNCFSMGYSCAHAIINKTHKLNCTTISR